MQNRSAAQNKFEISRKNLLAVVIFTTINVLMVLFNAGLSFLFSAKVPEIIIQIGMVAYGISERGAILFAAAVISFAIIIIYFSCYVLSKKRRAFILVALIMFSVDFLFLIWTLTLGFDAGILIDFAFHVWVMYYFIIGTKAWADLKKMPPEEEMAENENREGQAEYEEYTEENDVPKALVNTVPLREQSPKGKVVISQTYRDLEIVVKRSFGVTELIVNGMVFAEQKGVLEAAYVLDVCVENTSIKVTMDYLANMELYVNGDLLARKKRLL